MFSCTLSSYEGALDKYNIYLFISNCVEDFRLNQYRYQIFQLILLLCSPCMRYFVNSFIFRVPIGYCIVYLLKSTLKNTKFLKYSYFFKSKSIQNVKFGIGSLPMPTLPMVSKSQLLLEKVGT